MDTIAEYIHQKYNFIFNEAAYSKSRTWWLVSNPGPVIVILVSYYYFCTWLGPLLMRNRKPFQLKNTLIVYNTFQVVMSLHLVYCGVVYLMSDDYNLLCLPIDYSDKPSAHWIATATWWYYFAKLTELLDTFFFVLRKKERQISTLHIFHHTLMSLMSWVGVKYAPGGQATLMAFINSFVHVILYGYYLVSALGSRYQKYLWWKKYLTMLQLVQFVIIVLHNIYPLFTDCAYPKSLNIMLIINSLLFIFMFGNFYIQNYTNKNTKLS